MGESAAHPHASLGRAAGRASVKEVNVIWVLGTLSVIIAVLSYVVHH
jgi:hypothetical protein